MAMKTQSCRNCGSDERYTQQVMASGGYGPNLLPLGWVGWWGPKFQIEVCGNCGLVDWFVPKGLLAKVKEKFTRV